MPKMKKVVSAVLVLLQPMIAKSVPGINAGLVGFILWIIFKKREKVFTFLVQIH